MRHRATLLSASAALLLLLLPSCSADMAVGSRLDGAPGGADGLAPDLLSGDGAFASGGSGNGALLVDATVDASEETNNASTAADFKAEIVVQVSRAGAPVTDAVVTVTSTSGTVRLQHDGQGSYSGEQAGYARRYQLDVTAGGDVVSGVRAEGPAIHTIDSPAEGARHPSGQSLEVRWTAGSAQEVTVETENMPRQTTADSGRFDVSGTFLTAEAGNEESDRVRVRRSNVQAISGGAAGSDLTVRLRNQVEFIVDAK